MAKAKKVVIENVSSEAFNEAFETYAKADATEVSILAEIDIAITAIREKFQDDLDLLKVKKEKAFEVMQVYCTEQKPSLFEKKKSFETLMGTVGFRTGTPKLKLAKGFTWPAVTNLLASFAPQYVRTVQEPNKELLLAHREDEEVAEVYKKCGVSCVQEESFFVDPKKEKND